MNADKSENEGNTGQPAVAASPIHWMFWLWVGLCLLYTLYVAPAGCLNSCLASLNNALSDEEFKCLTGAVVGIPIGFLNGLNLLISGIVIRRTRNPRTRIGAWVFILINMLIYVPYTTSGFLGGWPFEDFWTVILAFTIHHGLMAVLLLMLWRISILASGVVTDPAVNQRTVNINQQL